MKTCTKCLVSKPIEQFAKMQASKDGHAWYCRACASEYQKIRRQDPEFLNKKRANSFRWAYGITIEQYNEMELKQDGLCAICNKPESKIDSRTGLNKKLSVDHCHNTKIVRGLLCSKCNFMIGLSGDSVDVLGSAIKYLEDRDG